MTQRFEMLAAKHTSVSYLLPGAEIGEDTISAPEIAITLSQDETTVITGEPGAIRSLAMRMIRASVLAEVKLAEQVRKEQERGAKKAAKGGPVDVDLLVAQEKRRRAAKPAAETAAVPAFSG